MPELYGTDYFIPAVVVVVLLAALLVLLAAKRRSSARGVEDVGEAAVDRPEMTVHHVEGAAPQPPSPLPAVSAAVVADATAPAPDLQADDSPPAETDLDLIPPAIPAGSIRVTVRTDGVRTDGGQLGTLRPDPLKTALLDILGGWGDLTPEDTKRLELYRPERVAAAVAALELPKSRSGDYTRTRLTQLRQFSTDYERKSASDRNGDTAPSAQVSAEVTPQEEPAFTAQPTVPPAPEPAPSLPPAFSPTLTAAGGLAAAVAAGTGHPAQDDASATAGAAMPATAEATPGSLDSFWTEPDPVWHAGGEVSFEEAAPPRFDEIDLQPHGDGDAGGIALFGAPTEPKTTASFWDGPSDEAFSHLPVNVETADQLLALPPEEQVDMIAFLPPAELVATFRQTEDSELKRAVIDTLEHVGSPASLGALGNCLDDPSCEIQLYALDAADRLLRVR